jgi:hypothetical protein
MADDTTIFVEDPKSLENTLKILAKFEEYAGLKLNKTKTEAMWIGKAQHNQDNQGKTSKLTWYILLLRY